MTKEDAIMFVATVNIIGYITYALIALFIIGYVTVEIREWRRSKDGE